MPLIKQYLEKQLSKTNFRGKKKSLRQSKPKPHDQCKSMIDIIGLSPSPRERDSDAQIVVHSTKLGSWVHFFSIDYSNFVNTVTSRHSDQSDILTTV